MSIDEELSGSSFGDHCSPISETIIVSSTGANCSQFGQFKTQLPYALMNGSIAAIAFLVAGWLASPVILLSALVCQLVLLWGIKQVYSKQAAQCDY
ncbi:Na+/H+ antiporter NhaC family protein [Alteromonas lipolytica]|uniref:Na+/H+ antiporter NhaC family protein n=1 Tax=Alteromonas lipolytica TaxID=1856405 RepID=UPI001E3FEA4E|nr:Na+/H+ antiporter NhaC family protein [Alteromonas lipolytica]